MVSSQHTSPQQRLNFIDSWRAFAVTIVLIAHLAKNPAFAAFFQMFGLGFIAAHGQIGVFIFFFISGFVVSKTLLAEVERTSTIDIGGFYIRRVFRILPPLMLYLLTYLLLGTLGIIDYSNRAFLVSSAYLCNTNLNLLACDWYTGHTWSLAFEEQFYLAFPLLFAFRELSKKPPALAGMLMILIVLPAVFPIHWIGRTGFVVIHGLFLAGYVAARFANRMRSIISRGPTFIFVIGTFLTFAPVGDIGIAWISKYYKFVYLVSIPCAVLASGMAANSLSFLFETQSAAYVGKISYSIYLWQQLLTGEALSLSEPWIQTFLVLLMLLLCAVSYRWFETPLITLGRSIAVNRLARNALRK